MGPTRAQKFCCCADRSCFLCFPGNFILPTLLLRKPTFVSRKILIQASHATRAAMTRANGLLPHDSIKHRICSLQAAKKACELSPSLGTRPQQARCRSQTT